MILETFALARGGMLADGELCLLPVCISPAWEGWLAKRGERLMRLPPRRPVYSSLCAVEVHLTGQAGLRPAQFSQVTQCSHHTLRMGSLSCCPRLGQCFHSIAFLQRKGEGEISIMWLMMLNVSFPFLLSVADGGLGLRDHGISAALLAAYQQGFGQERAMIINLAQLGQ